MLTVPPRKTHNYWRIANFLFPFYTMTPGGYFGEARGVGAWVPVDDEHAMRWSMSPGPSAGTYERFNVPRRTDTSKLPDTTD